nr:metallophosphoesterase [Clostridia bacterium]
MNGLTPDMLPPDLRAILAPDEADTEKNEKLVLGLFADSHFAEADELGSRRPRASYDKLKKAIEYFKSEGVNMIICLGDLINASRDEAKDAAALQKISALLRESGILTYMIWGNHDTEAFDADGLWDNSGFFSAPAAVSAFGANLILLDFNFTVDEEKYAPGTNDWTNTAMPREQMDWLKDRLRKTDGDIYVFCHQNLDGNENDPHRIANADEVRKLLEKYENVKAVYQGHRHGGGYSCIGDIEYITLKAMCEAENDTVESFCKVVKF